MTAPAPVLPIAQALVVEMGAEPFVVSEQDRPAYADAVRAAVSFSTAIVDQSAGTLSGIGVERPGLVLGALVRSAVDNALPRPTVGRTTSARSPPTPGGPCTPLVGTGTGGSGAAGTIGASPRPHRSRTA